MYIWYNEPMKIDISQQISATYARNHFREVTERAQNEGKIIIIHKSSPSMILMTLDRYETETSTPAPRKVNKMTLAELRKESFFKKYEGALEPLPANKTSVELQHEWYKYID